MPLLKKILPIYLAASNAVFYDKARNSRRIHLADSYIMHVSYQLETFFLFAEPTATTLGSAVVRLTFFV